MLWEIGRYCGLVCLRSFAPAERGELVINYGMALGAVVMGAAADAGAYVAIGLLLWMFTLLFAITPYRLFTEERRKCEQLEAITKPRVSIICRDGPPWAMDIERGRTHPPGHPPTVPLSQWVETEVKFFRFQVFNPHPGTIAHGCQAYLNAVEYENDSGWGPTEYGDTLRLRWAAAGVNVHPHAPRNVPHEGQFFVDVVSTDPTHNIIFPKWDMDLVANQRLFERRGRYRLTVFVSSEDGGATTARLGLLWTGDWTETRMWDFDSVGEANGSR
jgi:hypothetical protein